MTKDQIEAEIKKIKEANADDEGMTFLLFYNVEVPLFEHDT